MVALRGFMFGAEPQDTTLLTALHTVCTGFLVYTEVAGIRMPFWIFAVMLVQSVTLLAGAFPAAAPPQPGTLNAFTGDVRVLEAGRTIKTGHGMAELLLSPGIFLRLGNKSELTLDTVKPEIQVRLASGEALIEAVDAGAPVLVKQKGATAIIRKPGVYELNGKRGVSMSLLSSLRSWSKARSEQLRSESAASAQTCAGDAAKWHGPAWYWDPWSASYTFLSASGVVTGPFGWPYYSRAMRPITFRFIPEAIRGYMGRLCCQLLV